VQEISDLLYDEMIFTKVLQQVEHSYDEDIKDIYQRLEPGMNDSDLRDTLQHLLAQRHSDVNRLHQEREKRLAKKHPVDNLPGKTEASAANSLSHMEPDSSDSASDNSEEAPIEVFADTRTHAGVSDGKSLTDGDQQVCNDANKNDVVIADLPQAKPPSSIRVHADEPLSSSLLTPSPSGTHALDGIIKLNEGRLQELKTMMEAEQIPQFPGDTDMLAGADSLDSVLSTFSGSNSAESYNRN